MVIWNGEKPVFDSTCWFVICKFFWRYGLAMLWLLGIIRSTASNFDRQYFRTNLDDPSPPYKNAEDFIKETKTKNLINIDAKRKLEKMNLNQHFINEFVSALTSYMYCADFSKFHFASCTLGLLGVIEDTWEFQEGSQKLIQKVFEQN